LLGPFVIFRLGDASATPGRPGFQDFALAAAVVRECVALPDLQRPAGLPPVVAGMLTLGRSSLPVIDLGRVLGLEPVAQTPEDSLYRAILILGGAFRDIGVLVNRVIDVRRIARGCFQPPDAGAPAWDAGGLVHAGGRATVLDPGVLLDMQARQRLAALTQQDHARRALWDEPRQGARADA